MQEIITIIVIAIEVFFIKRNHQLGAFAVVAIYCLFPIVLGLNLGMRFNIVTLSVGAFMFATLPMYRKKAPKDVRLHRLLILYGIYVVTTSFIAVIGTDYVGEYVKNVLAFYVNFIFIGLFINHLSYSNQDVKRFNIALSFLILFFGCYGIVNYIVKFNPYIAFMSILTDTLDMSNAFMEEERAFLSGRISSTFIHPLQLGQVSTVLFPYVLFSFHNINKYLKLITLLLLMMMCLLCGSRSALIPLALSIAFYFFFKEKDKIIRYSFSMFFIVIFAYSFLPSEHRESVNGFLFFWDDTYSKEANIQGSSFEMRITQFENGLYIIRENPFFGFGQGYVSLHGDSHDEMLGYESFVFQFLVDGGVFGLFVFILFYFALYYFLYSYSTTHEERGRVHALCSSYFLNILFTGIQSGTFIVYIVIYYITLVDINNSHIKEKKILYDTEDNTLLLAE